MPLPQCKPLPRCNASDWAGRSPSTKENDLCHLRSLCDTQLYMRKHLNGSIFRRWTDESGEDPNSVIASGMEGAVLIDAGRPEYEMHLRNMASWMLRLIPESAGLAFDGTGWQGLVDLKGDDGRTYIELHEPGETGGPVKVGRVVHSQVTSKLSIQRVIGELLHSKGRAHFWNPYAPRADFMQHTDGIFAEDSYEDERMHLLALLGAGGKPVLSWNHGCDIRAMKQCTRYQDSNNNEQLLHRLLYWGLQPMVPFSRNDHGKEHIACEPNLGVHVLSRRYYPLASRALE